MWVKIMFNIAIRADGGPAVGMGHVMRCIAIAQELKNKGCRVYFIGKYVQGIQRAEKSGFSAFYLYSEAKQQNEYSGFDYGNSEELEEDIISTQSITAQQGCDLLLIDKYNLTEDYFYKVKEFINKVAFIDDLNVINSVADIIINGNINASQLGYTKVFPQQKLLLGTEFTPIREEFRQVQNLKKDYNKYSGMSIIGSKSEYQTPQIMITTGGSDPYNCTGMLINLLMTDRRSSILNYNIVATSGFKHLNNLIDMANNYKNMRLYVDLDKVSEIMCDSDIAISSGGSTLYELCCCGTPTLSFIMAENQKEIVDTFQKLNYIQTLGWYNLINGKELIHKIVHLVSDNTLRKQYSLRMQSLIDGKGAVRIAEEIVKSI